MLRNAVLRYATADAAAAAAQGMSSAAMGIPNVANSDSPIAAEPVRPVSIPGHADLIGELVTQSDGDRTVQELIVISAHGPYVLVQVAQSAQDPDRAAALTGRLLDLQVPLIDRFQPTEPGHFADLPLDPTGVVARTLPWKPGQGDSMSNATYNPRGALHLEDNPIQAERTFTDAGVDVVSTSTSQTTVYQARDPDGARRLAQALGDVIAQRPASQPAAAGEPLCGNRRGRRARSPLLVHRCVRPVCVQGCCPPIRNAHQQMSAQYLTLTR